MNNLLTLTEAYAAFSNIETSLNLESNTPLLAPAPKYSVGDITSPLAFKLAASKRCSLDSAALEIQSLLSEHIRERITIVRGYLNLRIDLIEEKQFISKYFRTRQNTLVEVQTLIDHNNTYQWEHIAALARARFRSAILKYVGYEITYMPVRAAELAALKRKYQDQTDALKWLKESSLEEHRALILYLCRHYTESVLDPWVPKFKEAANIYWYLSETVLRLQKRLEGKDFSVKSIVLEGRNLNSLEREATWASSMLGAYMYRAGVFSELEQCLEHICTVLTLVNRLCLEAKNEQNQQILSSALKTLQNSITVVANLETLDQIRSVV